MLSADDLDLAVVARLLGELAKDGVITLDPTVDPLTTLNASFDQGLIDEELVANMLAGMFGLARATEDIFGNQVELAALGINVDDFRPMGCKPLSLHQGRLRIGIADPSKLSIVSTVKNKVHRPVEPFLVTFSELGWNKPGEQKKPDSSSSQSTKQDKSSIEVVDEPKSEVVKFVSNIIGSAIKQGASDIHVETCRDWAQVRFRIDGALYRQAEKLIGGTSATAKTSFLFANFRAVVARLKIMANLDISERRLPQDGAIFFKTAGAEHGIDIRVSILPSQFGERVVMRILDKSAVQLDLATLGFPERILTPFKKAIESPQGLILVTGPTGSGKTTSQYAALNHLNNPSVNILTVEDPIEYNLEGVSQVQVNEEIGFSFSAALRSFLRQDPEVLLVGEIRDLDTVDIALKAALTGHLVLSTIHTNSSTSTIYRLINMGVETYLIASAVSFIMAQRLAKKLCPNCRVPDTESMLRLSAFMQKNPDIGIDSITPMKSVGCDSCSNRGFKGRVGIYEGLAMDAELQAAILEGRTELQILELAKTKGFKTMQQHAIELVRDGVITFEEFSRVVMT